MPDEAMERPLTAASFNQFISEKKLMASRCTQCNGLYLPPRAICPKCHSDQLVWVELKGSGKLAAFTSIFIGPTAMNDLGYSRINPYLTGVVELDEGVKISARILDVDARNPASIAIGMPLKAAFIEQGEGEQAKTVLAFSPEA